MLEVAADDRRFRDQWRRIRFVVDQARAWSESEHGGLRAYLARAAQQGQQTSRVVEAALPETDASAVRIMTVHAAKGLEFPIVIMSGMTAAPRVQSGVRVLWPRNGGYAVSLRKGVTTGDFDAAQPIDEQMDDRERRRLLYVAATRACDHLVVSLHRGLEAKTRTSAQLLAILGQGADGAEAWTRPAEQPSPPEAPTGRAAVVPPDYESWFAALTKVRAQSAMSSITSPSGLEGTEPALTSDTPPGAAKGPRDVDLPPWSKGRDGTAVGRAVHAVLQSVDLATGAGLEGLVSAQCTSEGVEKHAAVVEGLARSALASETVRRAATRRYWRETYLAAAGADGSVVEGFVDLVYVEDDGAPVVVDHKTDAIPAKALGVRAQYYGPQLREYVRLLELATGVDDVRAELLFLHPERAAVTVPVPSPTP